MVKRLIGAIAAVAIAWLLASPAADDQVDKDAGADKGSGAAAKYWPSWRGPLRTGVAPGATPPLKWSERKNVRWRVPLPGLGHSTPIVWGDRIFLTAAVPTQRLGAPIPDHAPGGHDNLPVTHHQKYIVIAVSRADGEVLWETDVNEDLPHEGGHYTASFASGSAVTDGEHVVAFFGSHGLCSLDLDGEIAWKKDLGRMQTLHGHGEGSSPALYGDSVIVNWDHEGQSFIAAFDKHSGEELWRTERDEVTSWASPLVVEAPGKPQVIVSGTGRVRSYDIATGRVNWECGGLSRNVVASPVAADGMVYVGSSYDLRAMLAIRLEGARGDITGSDRVAWTRTQRTPYVPSPLLYGEALYFLRHYQGILTRVRAKTGEEPHGPLRLHSIRDVYASPVGAAGRIYITDLYGMTVVVSHDEQPRVLAENQLDDSFSASAAIAGRELYLRGRRFLYAIAEE